MDSSRDLAVEGLLNPLNPTRIHHHPRYEVDLDTPLHELFGSMPPTRWPDANLDLVVEYLRGCQKLAIPPEFRPILPHFRN